MNQYEDDDVVTPITLTDEQLRRLHAGVPVHREGFQLPDHVAPLIKTHAEMRDMTVEDFVGAILSYVSLLRYEEVSDLVDEGIEYQMTLNDTPTYCEEEE